MEYCTPDDVRRLTNVKTDYLTDEAMKGLIEAAQRRCDSRLSHAGIELPITEPNDRLRDAAAYTTASIILARRNADMTRSASLSMSDTSFSTNVQDDIRYYDGIATAGLTDYIRQLYAQHPEWNKQIGTVMHVVEGE